MIPTLSERFLGDIGGWQALKAARGIHAAGRVRDAAWSAPMLTGMVREGDKEYRAGLRIAGKTDIENLCTCREARREGKVCAHSLAVGLEVLKPTLRSAPPAPAPRPEPKIAEARPAFSDPSGPKVALHVVLPPNFASVGEKGQATVVFEAEVAGRRTMLSALPNPDGHSADPIDQQLAAALRQMAGGEFPGMLALNGARLGELLGKLIGHPRVTIARKEAVEIGQGIKPPLQVEAVDAGLKLQVELPSAGTRVWLGSHLWIRQGTRLEPVAPGLPPAYAGLLQQPITIPADAAANFAARELPALEAFFEVRQPGSLATVAAPQAVAAEKPVFHLMVEGSLNYLSAQLEARYGDRRYSLDAFSVAANSVGGTRSGRNFAEERAAAERLREAGFSGPDAKGQWVMKGEPTILRFFARDLPRLEREWSVRIGERFEHVTQNVERVTPRLEIRSSGENWFDLSYELSTPTGERFSGADIQRLLQAGQNHLKRRDGKIAVFDGELLDEFQQVLRDCEPDQRQPGVYRIAAQHAAYVGAAAQEHQVTLAGAIEGRTADWLNAERKPGQLAPVPLGRLESVLREYQKQGAYWMHFLAGNRFGGILADEMGLGKTLQALAFLNTKRGRALVVCPSSLTFNWEREAARFAPEIPVKMITGKDRLKVLAKAGPEDLLITSYPLLRRDSEHYRGLSFKTVILDEAQHIKNPESQNAQAATALKAEHRFVLTGTPVENSVRDIWSLMNFLMPGYLGRASDFRERYEKEIQSDPGGPAQQRLTKRLRPFMLRRRKRDVSPELPEKIVQVSYCELTDAQMELYKKLHETTRRSLSELAGKKDQNKARIMALTALLRLRQACLDLRLLGQSDADPEEASAKLQQLDELLDEVIDGGHQAIVFSQFATMLQLVRQRLNEREIAHCHLDGSTRDRAAQVDRFQAGQAPVFLVSLKAGGTGLNLTAADTVIHFDPWWNPAVEAQANDRAHRIGQTKTVTVYKLIARGTVEEKILALQERKAAVAAATVESEEPMMDGLTMDEITELLA